MNDVNILISIKLKKNPPKPHILFYSNGLAI